MGRRIDIPYETLYFLYVECSMSQRNIAKLLGCSTDAVVSNLRRQNIPSHTFGSWCVGKPVDLSSTQRDFLYGALLGDGCLFKSKNGANSCFSYTSKSKHHVEFVMRNFEKMLLNAGIYYTEYTDKRTQKTYSRYTARTVTSPTFEDERVRWYNEQRKIVPKDLILNPTICLVWFIGDGCLSNGRYGQVLQLSTDCFSLEEVKFLCEQLADFEARPVRYGEIHRIHIPRHRIKAFLDYIGECPFDDYAYKWDFKEYQNFSVKNQPELIERIIEMFKSGVSAGSIAKEYGVDRSTVVKYLTLNGFNPKDNLFKRKKVICE